MQQTALKTSQPRSYGPGDHSRRVRRGGRSGGGDWEHGWGPQDDEESIAAVNHALERGINWIDTAAAYGFGHSERVVGRALEGLRERPYVFTKCSLLEGPGRRVVHSLSRDSILREVGTVSRGWGVEAIDGPTRSTGRSRNADIEEGLGRAGPISKRRAWCATSGSRTSTQTSCVGSGRSRRSRLCSRSTR